MVSTIEPFLDIIAAYGPLGLGVALLLAGAGLPIPTGALLLAAGAFARDGVLDPPPAMVVALVGAVLGDLIGYGLGQWGSGWVARFARGRRATLWYRAQDLFQQHGALAIWSTRFLLTSLDKPTSLIAGGTRYDLRCFVVYGITGRAAWLALYGGVGYAFGSEWQVVADEAGSYVPLLAPIAAVAGAIYMRRLVPRTVWRKRVKV
jgi:membrane-associated protein